jgi:hypothetical protein
VAAFRVAANNAMVNLFVREESCCSREERGGWSASHTSSSHTKKRREEEKKKLWLCTSTVMHGICRTTIVDRSIEERGESCDCAVGSCCLLIIVGLISTYSDNTRP